MKESICSRLGRVGNLEIARSSAEHLRNFLSAGGGGFVTLFTVVVKFLITHSALGPLALFSMANFILSFLLMQFVGFRLATKQSPLIGAAIGRARVELSVVANWSHALSRRWRKGHLTHSLMNEYWKLAGTLHRLAKRKWDNELLSAVCTQFLSALGNLSVVVLSGLAFGWFYRLIQGSAFLDVSTAKEALRSFDPFKGRTLFFAAITGGLLWASAWVGAWISRARGTERGQKARLGVWTSICLGAALAGVPWMGRKLGMGLDVRHFTLSAGTAALAVSSLGLRAACDAGLVSAVIGIFLIGILNFGVSFVFGFLLGHGVSPSQFPQSA